MADEKQPLTAPVLPNVVKGDGRYLMTLLKDFLTQTAQQVNLANGFNAEPVDPADEGKVPMPKNFFLSFNRLGGTLSWDHIPDVSILRYYELRENTNVGSQSGLLERVLDNSSTKLPISYVGHIYLYAIDKQGEYSTAAQINYTKSRPTEPKDIALTKNAEGTLVSFLAIPTDCIGANVYINQDKYQVFDNIFLYTGTAKIETVGIAYYDSFGEGQRGMIYCIPPDITGFIVERNGANLDFYWDPISLYGVHYVVKVSTTPDWDRALELFDTKINKHRYIYPNIGEYYLLIKAVDEHNNYSKNAAYALMMNVQDISKNVIISLDQRLVKYNGNKINMYYDIGIDGLKLDKEAIFGEYIVDVELPQWYRARNWFDYKVIGITNTDWKFKDLTFTWDSDMAKKTTWMGVNGDLNGVNVKHQIARYIGPSTYDIEIFGLNNTTTGDKQTIATEVKHADDFRMGRWHTGLYVGDLTKLAWNVNITKVFSLVFYLKTTEKMTDCILMTLRNEASFLLLGYSRQANVFYLSDSNGNDLKTQIDLTERDWLTFGISQGRKNRSLFVSSLGTNKTSHATSEIAPFTNTLNQIYCYPKIIL